MLPVDHIGVAVHDGMAIEGLLSRLAHAAPALPENVDQQGIRVRFYGSDTHLEVLESLDASSAVARYLSKHGEGLHHIAFRVADAQLHLERMQAAGFQPLTETPVRGAGGNSIFFLHPKQTCGILVEFCQPNNQYSVQFTSCTELEQIMQTTGYCISPGESPGHVVTGGALPQICQSLVVHNTSRQLSQKELVPPSVPILISEISAASKDAYALQEQWTSAQLITLPESSQLRCLPAVLLNFWASLDNG